MALGGIKGELLLKTPNPYLRWTPHPVIVAIRDNRDYIKLYYIPTISLLQGGGPPNSCVGSGRLNKPFQGQALSASNPKPRELSGAQLLWRGLQLPWFRVWGLNFKTFRVVFRV